MTFQPAHPDLIDRMSRLEHFSKLSQADLAAIIDIGRVRKVDEGEWIFREGEPCAGLYVLLSGQVHLHKVGPEGQEHIMVVLKPVTMFNEVAVLDGGVNPATAIAARESVVWRADREEFLGLIDQYPAVGIGMLPILARRNRELVTKFEDLSFRTVRARTAKLLLELSRFGERPIDRRSHSVNNLAAQICTAPEAVSRSITFFKLNGYIFSSRNRITVREPVKLAELAQIAEPCFAADCR
jgi:CRP/FNR family transcriptional regulator